MSTVNSFSKSSEFSQLRMRSLLEATGLSDMDMEQDIRTNTTHPSILHRLPIELLLDITSFQSLRSQMALALTCRSFFYTLLTERKWDEFNHKAEQKHRFACLMLFDHLYPQHYPCKKCASFHRRRSDIERVDGYDKVDIDELNKCEKAVYKRESVQLYRKPRLRITSHMVKLLHRATRLGPEYGIALGSLCGEFNDGYHGDILNVKTMIIGKHLMSRTIRRIQGTPEMLQPPNETQRRDKCFHWTTENEAIRQCLYADETLRQTRLATGANITARTAESVPEGPYAFKSPVMQCAWCPSLIVAALERGQDGCQGVIGIVIVRWVDLGMAPKQKDAAWKAHTRKLSNRSRRVHRSCEMLALADRASPSIACWFEEHVGNSERFDVSWTDFGAAADARSARSIDDETDLHRSEEMES